MLLRLYVRKSRGLIHYREYSFGSTGRMIRDLFRVLWQTFPHRTA